MSGLEFDVGKDLAHWNVGKYLVHWNVGSLMVDTVMKNALDEITDRLMANVVRLYVFVESLM